MTELSATEVEKIRSAMGSTEVTGDEAKQVLYDVLDGTDPHDSPLIYTAAMLRYRAAIEADVAAMPRGRIMSIPDL